MFVHEINNYFLIWAWAVLKCIEYVFYKLSQYTHGVSKKFEYFVSFLRQNCITIIIKAMLQTLCTKFMIKILL